MTLVKTYSMDDVGTRMEHLMELQDTWSFALGVLTTDRWHSGTERANAEMLENALLLLNKHIQSKYVNTAYAREINALPKPSDSEIT
jgi:hypothetical protein